MRDMKDMMCDRIYPIRYLPILVFNVRKVSNRLVANAMKNIAHGVMT